MLALLKLINFQIKYEFENLKRLNHENIVRVHELYIDVVKGKIYTVMELVNCGEIFETIKNSGSYTGIFKLRVLIF